MNKLTTFTSTILKLSFLLFLLSFMCLGLGFGSDFMVNLTAGSFLATIVLIPFYFIFKFSNAIINLFKKG